jgi:hypothetical protein
MKPTFVLGPDPLLKGDDGSKRMRPATLFLKEGVLVTEEPTHFMQALHFREHMDRRRLAAGRPVFSEEEWGEELCAAVLLYFHDGWLDLPVRRNPVPLLLRADAWLQSKRCPKNRIRFPSVNHPELLEAIRSQGGLWRVTPRPRDRKEMVDHIRRSQVSLGLTPIYRHNPHSGTRLLTCGAFAGLADLVDDALAAHLVEVAEYLELTNRDGEPEVALWPVADGNARDLLVETDWKTMEAPAVREAHQRVVEAFREETPPALRRDEPREESWVKELFSALVLEPEGVVVELRERELGPEFIYQVRWLPGATFKGVGCVLDSILGEEDNPEAAGYRDETAIEVIKNVAREFGDLEFINIGRIVNRLRGERPGKGRRDVFLVEFKRRGHPQPELRVIRFQRHGIREHLQEGEELLDAIFLAQDYTEYILNRRLGCRQLGMNLPRQFNMHQIPEPQPEETSGGDRRLIWATYFERDFIHGTPSPEIPGTKLGNRDYALAVAGLLGAAAAVNLIVGRVWAESEEIAFDQGNEVLREHPDTHLPEDLIFCHHAGSFGNYRTPLKDIAAQYAGPVVNRAHDVIPYQREFADSYLKAFQERFTAIQRNYREDRESFDLLFKKLGRDPNGCFGERWDQVLKRLDQSDPEEITEEIRRHIRV